VLGDSSPADKRLARVLLDLLETVEVVPLDLRSPTDPIGTQVASRLRENPGADLDVVARDLGASRRTFERRFRDHTGMSLGRWRQRLQLVMAIELLARGASVSEAGWEVGYASTSAFVTAFRRQLGTTPGRYFNDPEPTSSPLSPLQRPYARATRVSSPARRIRR
jgi:AraC-like DNA-binding protein